MGGDLHLRQRRPEHLLLDAARLQRPSGQIDENPSAAFAIDEYSDGLAPDQGGPGARPGAPVVQGEGIAKAADLFGQKYPELRPGSTSAVMFFRIDPDALEFIDNSRGVQEGDDFGAEYRRQSVLDLPAIDG